MKHVLIAVAFAIAVYYTVFHKSSLDTLMVAQAITSKEQLGMKVIQTTPGGFKPTDHLVSGAYTVIYFYSDTCPGCASLDSSLSQFLQVRPDVAVRKFHLGSQWSIASAQDMFNLYIGQTPFIHIYGPTGKLIAADDSKNDNGFKLLYDWMNAELQKDFYAKQRT